MFRPKSVAEKDDKEEDLNNPTETPDSIQE
jgi:hypothetical protein